MGATVQLKVPVLSQAVHLRLLLVFETAANLRILAVDAAALVQLVLLLQLQAADAALVIASQLRAAKISIHPALREDPRRQHR